VLKGGKLEKQGSGIRVQGSEKLVG